MTRQTARPVSEKVRRAEISACGKLKVHEIFSKIKKVTLSHWQHPMKIWCTSNGEWIKENTRKFQI